jgi:hypothetical protein
VAPNEGVGELVLSPDDSRAISLERWGGCAALAKLLALADQSANLCLEVLHVGHVLPQTDVHTSRYRHQSGRS